jgi:uncharacterized membrane protein YqhA
MSEPRESNATPIEALIDNPVRRMLGWSRLLVLLAVLGSFIASATLMVYGVLRSVGIIAELLSHWNEAFLTTDAYGKTLIAETIALIDMFLLGTVLFIVAAGLYQLFIDARTALPGWLRIRTLDDLKSLLTGVIIVALLVTFLGSAVSWKVGTDILYFGLAVAAVVLAANISMRSFGQHSDRPDGHDRPTP